MALIHCTNCGATISDKAPECPKCGASTISETETPVAVTPPQSTYKQPQQINQPQSQPQPEYQEKIQAEEPYNLDHWNWGAFTFGWLWGVFNGVYWPLFIFLAYLIPHWIGGFLLIVGSLVIAITLGINGNKLAWKNCTWRDAMQFQFVQRNWNIAGGVVWCFAIAMIILFFYYATIAMTYMRYAKDSIDLFSLF